MLRARTESPGEFSAQLFGNALNTHFECFGCNCDYKSLLWMTDFLPPFGGNPCLYQCTRCPGNPGKIGVNP